MYADVCQKGVLSRLSALAVAVATTHPTKMIGLGPNLTCRLVWPPALCDGDQFSETSSMSVWLSVSPVHGLARTTDLLSDEIAEISQMVSFSSLDYIKPFFLLEEVRSTIHLSLILHC
jgi:hypothetical protein